MKMKSRKGQTMVEYILIVVLIAITLIALFGFFGQAIGKKVAGATSALDSDIGEDAAGAFDDIDGGNKIRDLEADGTFGGGGGE